MTHYSTLEMFMQMSFYMTTLALISQRTHLLMALLCLEGMMLSLVLFIPTLLYMLNLTLPTISIIMLTFGACEASLGLSIMVNMSRSYGSDMMKTMTSNKC